MRSFDFPVFTITLEPLASFSTVIQQFSPGTFLRDHCSDSGVLDLANRTDRVDFSPNSSFSDIALEIESTTAAHCLHQDSGQSLPIMAFLPSEQWFASITLGIGASMIQ